MLSDKKSSECTDESYNTNGGGLESNTVTILYCEELIDDEIFNSNC